MELSQFFLEVLHEFRTIVSEHKAHREGKYLEAQLEELLRCPGSMGIRGPGKSKSRVNILKGDDVPSGTMDMFFYRIKGYEMSYVLRNKPFGLTQYLPALYLNDLAVMAYLLGECSKSS